MCRSFSLSFWRHYNNLLTATDNRTHTHTGLNSSFNPISPIETPSISQHFATNDKYTQTLSHFTNVKQSTTNLFQNSLLKPNIIIICQNISRLYLTRSEKAGEREGKREESLANIGDKQTLVDRAIKTTTAESATIKLSHFFDSHAA